MTATPSTNGAATNGNATHRIDALVIGAGIAGLYQIHQLRKEGMKVLGVEAGADVGGTWYWNRYPGAKVDSESYIYHYLFDEDVYKDWTWSKRFPDQPEIERWMHYVADRLDLRKDIRFGAAITKARYDEDRRRWTVHTDKGDVFDAQFVIGCTGFLSAPLENRFPGQETFRGPICHTARWPKEGIDLEGKRVGVVGIGATGIQIIQTIAEKVGLLKVFIRTPQYVLPMKNPTYGPAEAKWYKSRFDELRANLPSTFTGFEYDFTDKWADQTPEQRRKKLEEIYNDGSLKLWLGSFAEMFFDEYVSEEISEFVREKMRARLKDPKLIETLVPTDYGFGTHRVPLETNYLEAFHRDNVEPINVRNNSIAEVVPEGIKLEDGTVHELDVIILAVGFDASSGAMARIDITGRDGMVLRDEWNKDIRTTLGLQKYGFPNLFMTAAPLAPSAGFCNAPTCIQQQTEWITDCIKYLSDNGKSVVEPTPDMEDAWVKHHDEMANATLVAKTTSWYTGANVPGKMRRVLPYTGGVGTYRQKCLDIAAKGYEGFAMT